MQPAWVEHLFVLDSTMPESCLLAQRLVQRLQGGGPVVLVSLARLFGAEPGVGEPQQGPVILRVQLDLDHRLVTMGSGGPGQPGHLYALIFCELEESTVVSVPTPIVTVVEEEETSLLGFHDELPWLGEPLVEALGPGVVDDAGGRLHLALEGDLKWA